MDEDRTPRPFPEGDLDVIEIDSDMPLQPNDIESNYMNRKRSAIEHDHSYALKASRLNTLDHDHPYALKPITPNTQDDVRQVGGAVVTPQTSTSDTLAPMPDSSHFLAEPTHVDDWQNSLPGPSREPPEQPPEQPSEQPPEQPAAPEPDVENKERAENQYFINFSTTAPKIFKDHSAKSFLAEPTASTTDYKEEILRFQEELIPFLEEEREKRYTHGMKVHLCVKATFQVLKEGEVVDSASYLFPVKSRTIVKSDDIDNELAPTMSKLEERIADQQERGSGYIFSAVNHFMITLARLNPLKGGHYIPSPRYISARKATINIQTQDEQCIVDCLVATLHPVPRKRHPERPSHYEPFRHEINTEGIAFPIDRRGIDKLERLNPQFSINVYAFDEIGKGKGNRQKIKVYPYRISKNRGEDKVIVNLLLLEDDSTPRRHFVLIKDLGRLTRSGNSTDCGMTWVCPYCLQHFHQERLLNEHTPQCQRFEPMATRYPEKGKNDTLSFTQHEKQQPAQYWAVMDWETREVLRLGADQPPECPLSPETPKKFPWIKFPTEMKHIEEGCQRCTMTKPCPKIRNSTENHCRLEPFSFAFKIVSSAGPEHDFPLRLYQGPDAYKVFLQQLKQDMIAVNKLLSRNTPMQMTEEEKQQHKASTHCNVCKKAYTRKNYKCRDHDHLTGKFRQSACNRYE